mmetsp:Transcript_25147/g.70509  ORF Transcript_25147/g.70509 Transcript_25147/m.70509 type:complete len:269 (+) Transcript_25147:769-1575(+)
MEIGHPDRVDDQPVRHANGMHVVGGRGETQLPYSPIPPTTLVAFGQDGQAQLDVMDVMGEALDRQVLLNDRGAVHARPTHQSGVVVEHGDFGRTHDLERRDVHDADWWHVDGGLQRDVILRVRLATPVHLPDLARGCRGGCRRRGDRDVVGCRCAGATCAAVQLLLLMIHPSNTGIVPEQRDAERHRHRTRHDVQLANVPHHNLVSDGVPIIAPQRAVREILLEQRQRFLAWTREDSTSRLAMHRILALDQDRLAVLAAKGRRWWGRR